MSDDIMETQAETETAAVETQETKTFTQDELDLHQGWGHSSIEAGIQFSTDANIKSLALSHHSPKRSDKEIHKMNGLNLGDKCFWAQENLKLLLDGHNLTKIIEPIEPAEQI